MGGPATCSVVMTGNSADEMIANGMEHLKQAHPDMVVSMNAMSKEAMDKWRADFQVKFDAAPEAAA